MFTLRVYFTDGRKLDLVESYHSQAAADRAAGHYIRDYSDPCGTGARVECVAVIDRSLVP